jgi:hypothetical protein
MHWVPQNPPECQFSANVNGSVAKLSILHIDKAEEALNWVNSLLELFKLTWRWDDRKRVYIKRKKKRLQSRIVTGLPGLLFTYQFPAYLRYY